MSDASAHARNPVDVLIADDHAPTRELVREALESDGFRVAAEVGDALSAVDEALRLRVAACLLDVRMPGGGGVLAARRICQAEPTIAVVMFTVSIADEDLYACLRAGAAGYLLKGMAPSRLAPALRSVLSGDAVLPRALVARFVDDASERRLSRSLTVDGHQVVLTAREWEVLELLRGGLSTSEMADRLYVSRATIRTHVASLLHKAHVHDRRALLQRIEGVEANQHLAP